ncbi:MAG: acyltransferase family protein, partial [Gemmatimonadetes bacterium]|nr:acyltransferase family protein [Gemmatimonadota bacterium]
MTEEIGGRRRIAWLDTARAYGIFLVFYGHFVEVISRGDNLNAVTQQKLIYAFHMPLFILLSGYLAKAQLPGLWPFLRKQAATRLLPVIFFSVLMVPIGLALDSLMDRDGFPPGVRARWVDDWQDLSGRLAPPHGKDYQDIRARLWTGMSDSAQVTVRHGAAGDSLTAAQRRLITRAINAQLDQRDLYSPEAFAGVKLPPTVQQALEAGTLELDDGDPVRSHNARLTWWTLFPED